MVKFGHSMVAGALLAFAFAAPVAANAATTGSTSALWADSGSYHACNYSNTVTHAQTITIQLLNSAGAVLENSGSISVPAGTTVEYAGPSTGVGFARCNFTGQALTDYRANVTVFRYISASGYYAVLGTSEAR